jgi:hypothetical protein
MNREKFVKLRTVFTRMIWSWGIRFTAATCFTGGSSQVTFWIYLSLRFFAFLARSALSSASISSCSRSSSSLAIFALQHTPWIQSTPSIFKQLAWTLQKQITNVTYLQNCRETSQQHFWSELCVYSGQPKTNTTRMNVVITLSVSPTKNQTITFVMNDSDQLPLLKTDFIVSQEWVYR